MLVRTPYGGTYKGFHLDELEIDRALAKMDWHPSFFKSMHPLLEHTSSEVHQTSSRSTSVDHISMEMKSNRNKVPVDWHPSIFNSCRCTSYKFSMHPLLEHSSSKVHQISFHLRFNPPQGGSRSIRLRLHVLRTSIFRCTNVHQTLFQIFESIQY